VFLHSPHDRAQVPAASPEGGPAGDGSAPHVRFLNVNRQVTAVTAGVMPVSRAAEEGSAAAAGASRDLLFVGTASSCMAYDVLGNADVFVADAADGAAALLVDSLPGISPESGGAAPPAPVVVAGGNCSLQAFGPDGAEAAWLVTSDQVSALTSGPALGGGAPSAAARDLLVASDDMELRAFRGDSVVMEVTETARASGLSALAPGSFAYSLDNGTVGVYKAGRRLWRVKARGRATTCLAFDLDADGDPEVLSGWASGKLEARRSDNGALVYREKAAAGSAGVAGIVSSDYRLGGGDEQAVVVGADGVVRGFLPVEAEAAVAAGVGGSLVDAKGADDVALEELQSKKRSAELTLRSLRQSIESVRAGTISNSAIQAGAAVGTIARVVGKPAGLPRPGAPRPRLEVLVRPSSRVQLRCAVALSLDAAVFDGESRAAVPAREASACLPGAAAAADGPADLLLPGSLSIPVVPPRNAPVALRLRAVAGARASADRFLAFELPVTLPEFAGYRRMRAEEEAAAVWPKGGLEFTVRDRPERCALWMQRNFLPSEGPFEADATGGVRAAFVCLRPLGHGTAAAAAADAATSLAAPRSQPRAAGALASAAHDAAVARGGSASATAAAASSLAASVASAFELVTSGADPAASTPSSLAHDGIVLVVEATITALDGGAAGTLVRVRCDSPHEAADVIQSLASSMGLATLTPRVAFPAELAVLSTLLRAVQEANSVRLRLSADLAEGANRVKGLVVRAEDARMMGDVVGMRAAYARLMAVNGELAGEHAKRAANHQALMGALRRINTSIQTAARLRLGPGRAALVSDCRAALKANNPEGVFAALSGTG